MTHLYKHSRPTTLNIVDQFLYDAFLTSSLISYKVCAHNNQNEKI